uniref:phosphatidylinositol-3,4,5-trisphosphate 5-phosphatase n=1 Tax=Nothobranchius furzeri TaxID=105023 RepID=A0A8C6KWD1_NOTFU
MPGFPPWYHDSLTRSKAEDLLSKAARDGSFLIRDSESVQGAYALCVLYQNCVYTYRILPNEDKKLSVEASDGVPIRFFTMLPELVEAYQSPNMGLVTHLQYSVQREVELDEEQETSNHPPQLPPRNFTSESESKTSEQASKSLSDTYLMRLQYMDLSVLSEEHQTAIQEYFRTAICVDAEQVQNGNPNLPGLKRLIQAVCKNLNSEISRILPTLEMLHRAMDQQLSPGIGPRHILTDSGQSVSYRLEQLTKLLYSIEDKVQSSHRNSLIPVASFEVKQESLGISTKMVLKVDVESGKLYFKKSKDGPEDKYFVHNKILQLVKSHKMHPKLVIVVETEREKIQRKEFVFNDTKKREGFCQLLQQMKNKHSEKPEPDMITVFIGTWNMGNAGPPQNIDSWFQCKGQGKTRDDTADQIPHDVYVIGTQEDPLGEREWSDTVKNVLRNITNISFKQVAIQTLWNIRIVVLAKPEHENRISHVFSDSVKTGIANTLGNKGAVGVSFMFNGTSFGFVNSHLTSGSEKKLRRNQNYFNILRLLNLGDKKLNPFDVTHQFTHLIWLGDLNYRVDFPSSEAEHIVTKIKQQQYQELLNKDQLNMERNDGKVFLHFDEEEITFPPTYRFERETREKYAYTKAKATGVSLGLVRSLSLVRLLLQTSQNRCTTDIMTSDHSPVFASFEVGVASQFVSKQGSITSGIQIMNCTRVICLSKLTPIISDPEYLLDQHILICVKSADSDESYGAGCIALRAAQFCYREFHITLTHHGEKTGTLTGGMQLRTTEFKPTEKLYEKIPFPQNAKGETSTSTAFSHYCKPVLMHDSNIQMCHHVCRSCATPPHDISNPSYMGVSFKSGNVTDKGWSYSMTPRNAPCGQGSKDCKKSGYDLSTRSPTGKTFTRYTPDQNSSQLFLLFASNEDEKLSDMLDNPLYGSRSKAHDQSKDQDHLQTDRLPPAPDGDADRRPLPSPRNRSFTCSEVKPQPPPPMNLHLPAQKKPVVPVRSEGGLTSSRPPLPIKSRPEPQATKPRDYRDSSELPSKHRLPARPNQLSTHRDSKEHF